MVTPEQTFNFVLQRQVSKNQFFGDLRRFLLDRLSFWHQVLLFLFIILIFFFFFLACSLFHTLSFVLTHLSLIA